MAAFIDDGYTITETIPATSQYEAVKIEFRPMLRDERKRLNSEVLRMVAQYEDQRLPQVERDKIREESMLIVEKSLSQHLVSWDIKNGKGDIVDHTDVKNWRRIHNILFEKIYGVIAPNSVEHMQVKN